jgi:hypothetical protein
MQISKLKTRKLFYNKWPIKIECAVSKGGFISRSGVEGTLEHLHKVGSNPNYGWRGVDKTEVKEFAESFRPFETADLQLRGEGDRFNIFLKDYDLLRNITTSLNKWIISITEPHSKEEFDFLLDNNKKVLCDCLPKEKYRYKIYLKSNVNADTRINFLNWMIKYGDTYNISLSTETWLMHGKFWIQDPFFYVKDQQNLSLCSMYLGNNIKKIEEFILRSKINTSCPI